MFDKPTNLKKSLSPRETLLVADISSKRYLLSKLCTSRVDDNQPNSIIVRIKEKGNNEADFS